MRTTDALTIALFKRFPFYAHSTMSPWMYDCKCKYFYCCWLRFRQFMNSNKFMCTNINQCSLRVPIILDVRRTYQRRLIFIGRRCAYFYCDLHSLLATNVYKIPLNKQNPQKQNHILNYMYHSY